MTTVAEALIQIEAGGAGEAKSALESVGSSLGKLGEIAAGVAAAGLAALGAGLAFSINEAMGSEDAIAGLNATLKAVGDTAPVTSKVAQELASQIQNVSRFSDEAAMSAESMLLRFENIGSNIFPQALKAASDLAAAMGTDMTSAAQALGRALDNPAEGIGRLNTQLKLFTKAQQEAIEKMAKAGDVEGAQAAILDALNQKVGGLAAAMGDTATGKIEKFKNQISDIAESIGGKFLPVIGQAVTNAQYLVQALAKGVDPLTVFDAALHMAGLDMFKGKLGELLTALSPITDGLANLGKAVIDSIGPIGEKIAPIFADLAAKMGPQFEAIVAQLGGILNTLAALWTQYGPTIVAAAATVISAVVQTVSGTLQLVLGIVQGILMALNGDFSGAWDAIQAGALGFVNAIAGIFGGSAAGIAATWSGIWNQLLTIQNALLGAIINAVVSFGGNIASAVSGAIQGAIDAAKAVAAGASAIGKGLIDGLVAAIKAGAGAVIAMLKSIIEAAIAAAKAAAGVASPSTITYEIATNVVKGLTLGMSENAALPKAAMGALVGGMMAPAYAMPTAIPAVPSGGGSVTNGGNTSVVVNVTAHDVADTVNAIDRELRARGLSLAGAA